jgi:hypothetical protein
MTAKIATTQAEYRLFKSSMPMNSYIFPNGRIARFVNGRFLTNVVEEIEHLEEQIQIHQNPYIYVDKEELVADPKLEDPMEALRAKIIAEYLAVEAKATNPKNDAGNYSPGRLTPQSSTDTAATAAGGSGAGLAQRLQNIVAGSKV